MEGKRDTKWEEEVVEHQLYGVGEGGSAERGGEAKQEVICHWCRKEKLVNE